jgi:RNA polymerase sigma-70 factor (ECF subfamily)
MNRLSDTEVAARLQAASRSLVGFAWMLTGDRDAADETYQETCLEAWRSRAHFDGRSDFGTWLRGIARNVLRRRRRAVARARRLVLEDVDLDLLESSWVTRELDGTLGLRREALQHCLQGIDGAGRDLLRQRYDDDVPLAGLAERSDRSVDAVKMSLHRLRKKLLDCIDQRLGREWNP